MWPWIQNAGWCRSINRSRSDAKAQLNGSPSYQSSDGTWARGVMGDDNGAVPRALRLLQLVFDEGSVRPVPLHALAGREVSSLVLDRAPEVRDLPAHPHVRSDLVRLALKEEIGPQGRADESGSVDPDHPRIEQVDPRASALFGEPGSRLIDLRPVELVVPEHVEDVRGRSTSDPQAGQRALRCRARGRPQGR